MADISSSGLFSTPPVERRKDGSVSRMRSHNGNVPVLPQTKHCPHCPAKFTRTTHLTRHLRTHTNERTHRCDICGTQFTRSDLLSRHRRNCADPAHAHRTRRKSCKACSESKIKCDLKRPCSRCKSRGRDCVFLSEQEDETTGEPPERSAFSTLDGENSELQTSLAGQPELENPANTLLERLEMKDSGEKTTDVLGDSLGLDTRGPAPGPFSETASTFSDPSYVCVEGDMAPARELLEGRYSSDMFDSLFSSLFSESPNNPSSPDDLSWLGAIGTQQENPSGEYLTSSAHPEPFQETLSDVPIPPDPTISEFAPTWPCQAEYLQAKVHPTNVTIPGTSASATTSAQTMQKSLDTVIRCNEASHAELGHYMYLFSTAFLKQMPIVHRPTFTPLLADPVLVSVMQACGALFIKTRAASTFTKDILAHAPELLMQSFGTNLSDPSHQTCLILAVVLLQAIGLFHQKSDQRTASNIHHGMLVMMIRRSGLIRKNASWQPPEINEETLDDAWRNWAFHEGAKRALLLSYLHDCCHALYFGLPPSYHDDEMQLHLPCEDALWQATTAQQWFSIINQPSPFGYIRDRLTGPNMSRVLAAINEPSIPSNVTCLSSFSHFVLIHSLIRDFCLKAVPTSSDEGGGMQESRSKEDDRKRKETSIYSWQFSLHNWYQSWLNCPELARGCKEELPFFSDALPFYWMMQAAIMIYQDGTEEFVIGVLPDPTDRMIRKRFRAAKSWLRHIRKFLADEDRDPTRLWDELMRLRLNFTQTADFTHVIDDQDGLLGFFADNSSSG